MKKFLLASLVFLCAFGSHAEPIPADDILAFVRTKLPADPIKLTGTLKVRTKKGFTKTSLPVEMNLDWGAAVPTATYRISDQSLAITWKNDQPIYTFSQPGNQPTSEILDTGINWADLSFAVLWWKNSQLVAEEKKINRECFVVDVPVPGSSNSMRLWIEKKMGMLLEAQTLDDKKKEIRRMKIKSIKKMDGMWVAKDLEITNKDTGNKTTLQITDLQWKEPKATAVAFDSAKSINQLSIDLFKQLATDGEGNLFLSPYSISTALAMTYGGARGETEFEMENAELEFTDGALLAIAKRALKRDTGARALRAITEQVMIDLMYQLPDEPKGEKYVITNDVIEGKVDILKKPKPKKGRKESA